MNAVSDAKTQVLIEPQVQSKLRALDLCLEELLSGKTLIVPEQPGRDVQILPLKALPPKPGLSRREGQARLLHDLASIELQAMELALRTLAEFPAAPRMFREQLAEIAREEGHHLQLCLTALEDLELPWGSFPTHTMLWTSAHISDSLMDRIVIVHRYLEGSGLDASDTILRRLSGVDAKQATQAVKVIRHDEVKHVLFGSHWHHRLALELKVDPAEDLKQRLERAFARIPRRLEPVSPEIRKSAGFLESEIQVLDELRTRWLTSSEKVH